MYTSQQQQQQQPSYKALPSSTRSRRVSGNHTGATAAAAAPRPGLHQAAFKFTGSSSNISNHSSSTSSTSTVAGEGLAASGISLQSWARSQYQLSQTTQSQPKQQQQQPQQHQQYQQQQQHKAYLTTPESPRISAPMYQTHYQYAGGAMAAGARPQSSHAVQHAVADYFDPYGGQARGQTLAVVDRPTTAIAAPPRAVELPRQQTPPSPLMRAVRHARPTTPQSTPASAHSSAESLRALQKPTVYTPQTPVAHSPQKPVVYSPQASRLKPRAHTATEDSGTAVLRPGDTSLRPRPLPTGTAAPRVASMYVGGPSTPIDRPMLHVDVARTPQRASFQTTDSPAPRSELIDFIERRRAQTVASDAPALRPKASDGDSVASRTSDASERSFKRSTARLSQIDPLAAGAAAAAALVAGERVIARPRPASAWLGSAEPAKPLVTKDPMARPPASSRIVPRAPASPPISADPPSASVFARPRRTPSPSVDPAAASGYARLRRTPSPSPNPYARNPATLSAGVQAGSSLRAMATRGVQTSSAPAIHSDAAVLDLMRQLDVQRSLHAHQITEYQEQVIDLELLNHDLQTEAEQLAQRLSDTAQRHDAAMQDMRRKLDDTHARVDRELADVKQMHAAKCDELGDQVAMLLGRCERYHGKLAEMGVSEDELLRLAAGSSVRVAEAGETLDAQAVVEQISIVDGAFIEKQYVETRESAAEADYFRQMMQYERSMENTTIALGFELKRTQAMYLQQAADFVREQMVRSGSVRAKGRPARTKNEPAQEIPAESADKTQAEEATKLQSGEAAKVKAEATPAETAATPPTPPRAAHDSPPMLPAVPPMSPVLSLAASLAQMTQSSNTISTTLSSERISTTATTTPTEQTPVAPKPSRILQPAAADGNASRPRAYSSATFSGYSSQLASLVGLGIDRAAGGGGSSGIGSPARGFDSEGRASGLTRMMRGPAAHYAPRLRSSTTTAAAAAEPDEGSDSDVAPTTAPVRSPLAALSAGFLAASQPHTLGSSSDAPAVFASLPRKQPRPLTPTKAATVHWPRPQSSRRPAACSLDMTAEQLLQSLKLPAIGAVATAAGSRTQSPKLAPVRATRHSPVPRVASLTDLAHSPASDKTLPEEGEEPVPRAFDPQSLRINLGLDKPGAAAKPRRAHVPRARVHRRRSRSVGTWDRATARALAQPAAPVAFSPLFDDPDL
ncbi:hypothetical protein LPJ53_005011 [Coemansia erecta]|uniref:Uncharacterized protein n=1 Tax=Coemansia erecta TaxID=147472 RepID=A0A9W7XWN4_9FUNG|nr:hypothetical protein LPJ53_005011 [Coemansia erecta]